MTGLPRSFRPFVVLVLSATLGACCSTGDQYVEFRFKTRGGELGETWEFDALTTDPGVIEAARSQLALPSEERTLHINGRIARGDGCHNEQWDWHFVPDQWQLTVVSIEHCDGTPEYVNEHLEEWFDEGDRYCPWPSRLSAEGSG